MQGGRKTYKYCIVPMCENTSVTAPDKIFISLPDKKTRRILWQKAMRRTDFVCLKGTKYCCEDHFDLEVDMENYLRFKMMKNIKIKMKDNVVPHKFECQKKRDNQIGETSEETQQVILRKGFLRRRRQELLTEALQDFDCSKKFKGDVGIHYSANDEHENRSPPLEIARSEPQVKDVEIQCRMLGYQKSTQANITPKVRSKAIQCGLEYIIDKKIVSTRVEKDDTPSFESTPTMSDTSFIPSSEGSTSNYSADLQIKESWNEECTVRKRCEYVFSQHPRLYSGIPRESYFVIDKLCTAAQLEKIEIFVTLKKIRLELPYSVLADDFVLTTSRVCLIIQKSIPKLAAVLHHFIQWRDLSDVEKRLPIPFRLRYKKVQAIIDCFEIEIQKPSDPILQSLSWSEYKKCNTMKYLISSAPDGLITFISTGYGDRSSDKLIVEECGFLRKLEPNAHVMADRGFKNIEGVLYSQNNILVRPPSVVAGKKSTKQELKEAKRVTSLRIHVERVISRIREFKILAPHSTINLNLIKYLDNILLIVCGLINIQGYLIKC